MSANPIWIAGYFGPVAGASPVWIAPGDGTVPSAVQSEVVSYFAPVAGATAVWIAGFFAPPPAAIGATPITISGWGGSGGGGGGGGGTTTSVWSAADASANAMTLSNGGLTVTPSANAGFQSVRSSISQTAGKFYVEFKALGPNAKATQMAWGIANGAFNPVGYLGGSGSSIGAFNVNAGNFVTAGFTSIIALGAPTIVANDVWAIAIDLTAGKYWMAQNNVWAGGGSPSAGTSPMVTIGGVAAGQAYFPAVSLESANSAWVLQSTAASQKYAPPSGFSAWDSAAPTHSPQALAYLARTVGGDEGGNGANIATLIDGLVSDGVWAKLDALYVLAQQNQSDALLNLAGTSYSLTGSDISTFAAYKGVGPFTAGLSSGFDPQVAPSPKYILNSANAGAWIYTQGPGGLTASLGLIVNQMTLFDDLNDAVYFYINSVEPTYSPHSGPGLYANDLNGSTASIFFDGVNKVSLTGVPALSSGSFTVGATSGGSYPSAAVISVAFIGGSLGAAGQLALYNRLRTYMTAIGVP